jgi:hypothetical protein
MISVEAEVYIDDVVNQIDDQTLTSELKRRGYKILDTDYNLQQEDYMFLLDLVDKQPQTWYTLRVRDKIFTALNMKG